MIRYVKKTTLQELLRDHKDESLEGAEYYKNPTIPDCERKYWKDTGSGIGEMTQGQKTTKDAEIVAEGKRNQSSKVIFNELLGAYTGDALARVMTWYDTHGSFGRAVDGKNWDLARSIAQAGVATTDLEQSDYDTMNGILPT